MKQTHLSLADMLHYTRKSMPDSELVFTVNTKTGITLAFMINEISGIPTVMLDNVIVYNESLPDWLIGLGDAAFILKLLDNSFVKKLNRFLQRGNSCDEDFLEAGDAVFGWLEPGEEAFCTAADNITRAADMVCRIREQAQYGYNPSIANPRYK